MWDPMAILTVKDVARYLRTDEPSVRRLIEAGEISSFDVGGEPRVQAGALIGWFQSEMHLKSLETLKRTLQGKETWAEAVEDDRELKAQIQQNEYEEGTFGAFLKAAVEETETSTEPASRTGTESREAVENARPATLEQQHPTDYLSLLRKRPFIAFLVSVGAGIIGLGAFTDALTKIRIFLAGLIEALF